MPSSNGNMDSSLAILIVLVVAFAAASFFTSGATGGAAAPRARAVSDQMVAQVLSMFPDMDPATIRADLAQTGSVESTIDRILSGRVRRAPPPPAAAAASTTATPAAFTSVRARGGASASAGAPRSGRTGYQSWIRGEVLAAKRAELVAISRKQFLAAYPAPSSSSPVVQ
ncbi:hypothetical protein BC828DRAFT_393157 [Blastocladiella britannica]|nr:hypothetical protein BC828DRAFT_393157 [Blastocladiella britannica]